MRKGIHPDKYRMVAFKDMSNDDVFLSKSTANTKETIEVDGKEYPLVKLEISRTSHPFYTGKSKLIDTAGRIDKFKTKYAKFKKEAKPEVETETKTEAKAEVKTDTKAEVKAEVKSESKAEVKAETKAEVKAETKAETKAEVKTESKEKVKAEAKSEEE